MTRSETIKFLVLRSIGNFLVLFAIYGVFATFGPALIAEAKYQIARTRGVTYSIAQDVITSTSGILPDEAIATINDSAGGPTFASVLIGSKTQVLVPPDPNFSLVIPKIGASAKIFPNADPTSEAEFLPLLMKGIAHAKGTVFPGVPGNTYLFAHSTDNWWNAGRYNAVFYLLKDLSLGDDIVVFFEGRRYNYIVTEKKIVSPTDVTDLVQSHGGPQQLVLQTCWPPGTTWERLLVIARLKSSLSRE